MSKDGRVDSLVAFRIRDEGIKALFDNGYLDGETIKNWSEKEYRDAQFSIDENMHQNLKRLENKTVFKLVDSGVVEHVADILAWDQKVYDKVLNKLSDEKTLDSVLSGEKTLEDVVIPEPKERSWVDRTALSNPRVGINKTPDGSREI